jgi:hypothetical protein
MNYEYIEKQPCHLFGAEACDSNDGLNCFPEVCEEYRCLNLKVNFRKSRSEVNFPNVCLIYSP